MAAASAPWWAWLLGLPFAAPWLFLASWYWRTTPKDGRLPPSMAELMRRRLLGGR